MSVNENSKDPKLTIVSTIMTSGLMALSVMIFTSMLSDVRATPLNIWVCNVLWRLRGYAPTTINDFRIAA